METDTKTTENAEIITRVYEVGYHFVPTIAEDSLDAAVGAVRSVIEKAGGAFIAEGAPVLTKLSYEMTNREGDKNVDYDRGYFGWIKFESTPDTAHALEESLKADTNVLRSLVFRTVREDTRAKIKLPTLREVRRSDAVKPAPRRAEEVAEPVSEEELDKAIDVLTTE